MSMQTDCIYGYGFKVCASDEQLKHFILAHKESLVPLNSENGLENQGRELVEYCENTPDVKFNPKEDKFDYVSGMTGLSGVYGAIADVMMAETGIRFAYYADSEDINDGDAILFETAMPWQFNDKEISLTEEELEDICNRYIKELNPSLTFDQIRMEYFG